MREQRRAGRKALTGQVIEVIDDCNVVINKGSVDGVNKDDRFLLYKEGKEIFDPENNEYLGRLELVCGEGRPKHIQERFTTLTSSKMKFVRRKRPMQTWADLLNEENTASEDMIPLQVPFEKPEKGCLFKQVR